MNQPPVILGIPIPIPVQKRTTTVGTRETRARSTTGQRVNEKKVQMFQKSDRLWLRIIRNYKNLADAKRNRGVNYYHTSNNEAAQLPANVERPSRFGKQACHLIEQIA